MQKDQNSEQGDLLNIQNSAQETHNSESPLIIHEPIENTPFTICGNEEKGYFIRMGSYRLTEYYNTIENAKNHLEIRKWDITVTIIAAILHSQGDQTIKMT